MIQTLNIPIGISTIGNSLNEDFTISTIDTTDIKSMKTLKNGTWTSWAANAPDMFQGFLSIKKGTGYVVNSIIEKNIILDGTPIDINSMIYDNGLSMISLPYNNRKIGNGYIPRIKANSIKTIDTDIWKSWTPSTPDAFQGFLTTNNNKGYVVDIVETSGGLITDIKKDLMEGIRSTVFTTTWTNNDIKNGITYMDPNALGILSSNTVTYDPAIPIIIMFISINGIVAKIDFPIEYSNKYFIIENNGFKYIGKFTENEDYSNPTILDITLDESIFIEYTTVAGFNEAVDTFNSNIIKVANKAVLIDYTNVYKDTVIKVWVDGNRYFTTLTNTDINIII